MNQPVKNEYMAKVMAQQAQVQQDLRGTRKRSLAAPSPGSGPTMIPTSTTPLPDAPAVDVRITGFWRWRRVLVPPNVYVVHTRLGHEEPVTCGLGTSFRYNPYTDSFLVVPSAIQTILISANCICRERQGILVQGYVQWIIGDIRTAYRKLDFSDATDPMAVVNVQLREQAEAAIKDMVSTMSIDEVLSDKQPIVEQLTTRLRAIAEGDGGGGLGLRISTVQIKEAIVSSSELWETLQRPFRAERHRAARLAELAEQGEIRRKEAEAREVAETRRIALDEALAQRKAEVDARDFDHQVAEQTRRAALEAAKLEQTLAHDKAQARARAELKQQALEYELALADLRLTAEGKRKDAELAWLAAERRVDNDLSALAVQRHLIDKLPAITQNLPTPATLHQVNLSGLDGLVPMLGDLLTLGSPKS
jgi:hypothetical protein